HFSRSLALRRDSGQAPIARVDFRRIASLRILAFKGDGKWVKFCCHQSSSDRRIFLHELSRGVFVGRFKDGNAKCLVAWFGRSPSKNHLTRLGSLLKAHEMSLDYSTIFLRPG